MIEELLKEITKIHLYHHLNLWDIAPEGMLRGIHGEAAFMYEINPGHDLLLASQGEMLSYISQVKAFFSLLPCGASVTFQSSIDQEDDTAIKAILEQAQGATGALKCLLESRAQTLSMRPGVKRRYRMVLALEGRDFLRINRFPGLIFKIMGVSHDEELKRKLKNTREELLRIDDSLLALLGSIGIKVDRLGREEAIQFLWKKLNPQRGLKEAGPALIRPQVSLRSQMCLSGAMQQKDCFWLDGRYYSGVSFFNFPEFLTLGSLDLLIKKLPQGSELTTGFMGVDRERALDILKREHKRSSGIVFLAGPKNFEAQLKAGELEEQITMVGERGERLLVFAGFVLVGSNTKEDLASKTSAVISAIRECLGMEAVLENFSHKRMFLACLPLGIHLLPRRRLLATELAAYLAPLSATWPGSKTPAMTFQSAEADRVSFDPFDEDSPHHGIVMGSTGSGKSFTMNYLIMSLYATDPRMRFVVIDIGGSYKRLCEILEGSYFQVTLSEDYAINPFPAKENMINDKGDLDSDLLGYLRLLMEKMLPEKASPSQKRIIEAAITRLYKGCPADIPMLGDFLQTLSSLTDEEDSAEVKTLFNNLRFFAEGAFGKILNAPSRINPFAGRLTVFDLAGLKEHRDLQVILIFLISFSLTRSFGDKSARKVVVIDEGWEFFNDPTGCDLVSRLYRTARKFNAVIVSASQSPRDFLKSPASPAMISNSEWKIFLRLAMGHEVLASFGLNPAQIEAVKSLSSKRRAYADMLLVCGNQSRVVRLSPSSLEYWIATTNPQECLRESQLTGQRNGIPRIDVLKELSQMEPVEA